MKNERYECSVAHEGNVEIVLSKLLMEMVLDTASRVQHEFIVTMYAVTLGAAYVVVDYDVQQQTVSPTSAALDVHASARAGYLLGFLHTHPGMAAFHSRTDEDGVDNAAFSVVLGTRDRSWAAKAAVLLPCARLGLVRARVVARDIEEEELAAATAELVRLPRPEPAGHFVAGCPEAAAVVTCGLPSNRLLRLVQERCHVYTSDDPYIFTRGALSLLARSRGKSAI